MKTIWESCEIVRHLRKDLIKLDERSFELIILINALEWMQEYTEELVSYKMEQQLIITDYARIETQIQNEIDEEKIYPVI